MQKDMMRATIFLVPLIACVTLTAQTSRGDSLTQRYNTEGSSKLLALEMLSYIHYEGRETINRPDYTLYYVDQEKSYNVQTSHNWVYLEENEIILGEINFVESCALQSDIQFKELNINWLNKQL
tara:strand:- start:2139 stop:2510 length:372 start_codon:yes stop_codon:yes gene_type:complete